MGTELELKTAYPSFTRICLRCGRKINGYGFYTLYGSLVVGSNGSAKKIHGCGDPVHYRCPAPNVKARAVEYYADIESGNGHYYRRVAKGIQYNARTDRYEARSNKKWLGSHETQDLAQAAIDAYHAK